MPDLLEWREEFPILANTVYIVYMISHSLGAMPRRTYAAMQEYAETWAERFDLPVDRHVVLRLVGEAQQAGH